MASKSPFDVFGTAPSLETAGIRVDYGSFWVLIARAGGANTKFRDAIRDKFRPYQRAIDLNEMDDKVSDRLTSEAFAETVVLGWGSEEFGEGKVPGADGKPVEFSVDAAKAILTALPDFAKDLIKEAQNIANFRRVRAEADGKN